MEVKKISLNLSADLGPVLVDLLVRIRTNYKQSNLPLDLPDMLDYADSGSERTNDTNFKN